jgi:acyl-CoA reductase-like NAD-dependent aldehyde dehydrogenase
VLLEDKRINAISFTGSVATGQRIAQACVARMAKFQLEMGGKNPMVVLTTPTSMSPSARRSTAASSRPASAAPRPRA